MHLRFTALALILAPSFAFAAPASVLSLSLLNNGSPIVGAVPAGTEITILATFSEAPETSPGGGVIAAVLGASGPWYSSMEQIDSTHFSAVYIAKRDGIDAIVLYDDFNPLGTAATTLVVGNVPVAPAAVDSPTPSVPEPSPVNVPSDVSTASSTSAESAADTSATVPDAQPSAVPETTVEATVPDAQPAVTPETTAEASVNSGEVLGAANYRFTDYLYWGVDGDDVKNLQLRLIAQGFLVEGLSTGYFGRATLKAVKAYQAANGLKQTGALGPATRAALNGK